ncbi:MAG: glycogen/starch synthase [Polyangiaceae bacterium]
MEILFAATELGPVVKVGGLADVVFALSKTLRNLGHRVTIAMPRYPAFEQAGVLSARRLTPLKVEWPSVGGAPTRPPVEVTVFDGRLATGVDLLLFEWSNSERGGFFNDVSHTSGAGIYDHKGGPVAAAQRFSTFAGAVVELMRQREANEQAFDVVHLHDWPTAMIAYLMRQHPDLDATRSVLTIHDISHQGMFYAEEGRRVLADFGLGPEHFTPQKLEFYGGLNMLKGGILAADAITTVSPTYAREIVTPEGGARLDGVLRARKDAAHGIMNGIDYAVWNPATTPAIVARYDADDPSNKGRCKTALLDELGLELDPARPLFLSLGRIVKQKGCDLLAAALPRLLRQDLSFVVAGGGDPAMIAELEKAASFAPERCKVLGYVSEPLAHRLFGAADFVMMPSRYEPCGLVQLSAQRYGAVPIATRTGGFIDGIVDIDAQLETGTGLLFDGPNVDGIVSAVGRALGAYTHPRFSALRRRIMRLDVGWDRPARRYVSVYKSLLAET